MARVPKLEGVKFDRLTVVERMAADKRGTIWKCLCDCGKEKLVPTGYLTSGSTRSCGCYKKDNPSHLTHGLSKTQEKTWRVWARMKQRCYDVNSTQYEWYGARGIKVCEKWKNSFAEFYKDMGAKPEKRSIDRINVDGDYEPTNCRWLPHKKQCNNRRSNILINYNGETKTLKEWSETLNFNYNNAHTRYKKNPKASTDFIFYGRDWLKLGREKLEKRR